MKITKLGHCCLLIEVKQLRILTDPGAYTTAQNNLKDIDLILITHEHPDHLHTESLKIILASNPNAKIITNQGVGAKLAAEAMAYELLEDGQHQTIADVLIEGFGLKHAEIYPTVTAVDNTGYCIENTFFYPGDAFTDPQKQIEILALPVAGPWMTLAQAIDYAKKLKPQHCFPVHDGMLKHLGSIHKLPQNELSQAGIAFVVIEDGISHNF
jgi:L-ascorbate metabolism protein UlaG (beta-lactamase superfamily)